MTQEELLSRSRARRQIGPAMARALRIEARVSQRELAEVLGVTPSALSRWERGGRQPRGELAQRYFQALGLLAHEVSA